jgi:murein DD-endopeptidase MepM/ murein hydrolase activator NlpD
MKSKGRQRGAVIPALALCFTLGMASGWFLRSRGAPQPAVLPAELAIEASSPAAAPAAAATTSDEPLIEAAPPEPVTSLTALSAGTTLELLRNRDLALPIDAASVDAMQGGFEERRDAGGRGHEAVDIRAPRNTPVRAVDDGVIAKLFNSKAGGITLYQYDPSGRFCYYYAHLERYADGIKEGQRISRGEVLGYVGTSGNAPPNTPHLHFAVFELDAERRWWKGRPIDPYLIFRP